MTESSAPIQAGITAPDLTRITQGTGPFLTLFLPLEPEIDNAAQKSGIAWKSIRAEMEAEGVPDTILQTIDPLVPDAHQDGRCLAVIGQGLGLSHVEHGPIPPSAPWFHWAELPVLTPIIEWRQLQAPYILVLTDRTGADLVAFQGEETVAKRVAGNEEHQLSRSKPGGWSQRRFQQRAIATWEDNAEAVAEELAGLAKQIDARLVLATGDVRALEMLEKELGQEVRPIFRTIEGGRGAGTDKAEIEEEARRQVAILLGQETGQTLDRFREEVGQVDLATEGADATLEALSRAQVDTLLVYDHPDDDRTAWFGLEPVPVAATEARLEELGIEPRHEGRLIDVLVRAALGTGSSVRVIPEESGVADNVGALLRWSA